MRADLDIKQGALTSPETTDMGLQGYIARSEDRKNVVQFRADGFTYNRLRPYTRWEEVFPRAMELWNLYAEASSPELVTRLAVRYVNHLRIPKPNVDFDDYLTSGPHVPPELPQTIGTFLTRVVILDSESGLAANVTQALEPPVDPRFTTVILDIDAFQVKELKPQDPVIRETFDLLRVFKNRIFFSHITEGTARLFE